MGFFDRFTSRKNNTTPDTTLPAAPGPATADTELPRDSQTEIPTTADTAANTAPAIATATDPTAAGNIKSQLLAANEKLRARDLPAAMAIYEEILRAAGDRADVLATLSADLGTAGYIPQIIELVAPRYDAERHGPATGLNLLQACLALHNITASQHLLDILFALNRPDLEERLHGFSNALAELIEAEHSGTLAPPAMPGPDGKPAAAEPQSIHLISISRPIWAYGLEAASGLLPSPGQNPHPRRVAFGQISILGIKPEAAIEQSKLPEDELSRFTRGFPLWLSETFYYSPIYNPIAALAILGREHYAIFPIEWTKENIGQLAATSDGGLDYVFTGALQQQDGATELLLRVWEVKKLRERKQFRAAWTPDTADTELARLHEAICLFMEWRQEPGVPAFTMPASPWAWCQTLGASLAFFLAGKDTLPVAQISEPAAALAHAARHAASSERETFAWLTLADRARRLGLAGTLPEAALFESPLAGRAQAALAGNPV